MNQLLGAALISTPQQVQSQYYNHYTKGRVYGDPQIIHAQEIVPTTEKVELEVWLAQLFLKIIRVRKKV